MWKHNIGDFFVPIGRDKAAIGLCRNDEAVVM